MSRVCLRFDEGEGRFTWYVSFPSCLCSPRVMNRRAARKQEKLEKKQAKKEAAEKRLQEKMDMRGYCIRTK